MEGGGLNNRLSNKKETLRVGVLMDKIVLADVNKISPLLIILR